MSEASTGEQWVALALKDGARVIAPSPDNGLPFAEYGSSQGKVRAEKAIPSLNFTPYGLRSNRGGRGHMRVGLRVYSPTQTPN